MLDSVRGRLALWHTAVLAVMLVAFAMATDLWLERAASRREDRFLEESAQAFYSNVAAELEEVPLDTAVEQALAEFRLRNVTFLVRGFRGKVIGRRPPPHAVRHPAAPDADDVARATPWTASEVHDGRRGETMRCACS